MPERNSQRHPYGAAVRARLCIAVLGTDSGSVAAAQAPQAVPLTPPDLGLLICTMEPPGKQRGAAEMSAVLGRAYAGGLVTLLRFGGCFAAWALTAEGLGLGGAVAPAPRLPASCRPRPQGTGLLA